MFKEVHINWPYKNFTKASVSCRCCGEFYNDPVALAKLQKARDLANVPFVLNSAHRCWLANARAGGAPKSMHKLIAFDISVIGKDRKLIERCCKEAGFTGFGYYRTFLHVDCGRPRRWYGPNARELWIG